MTEQEARIVTAWRADQELKRVLPREVFFKLAPGEFNRIHELRQKAHREAVEGEEALSVPSVRPQHVDSISDRPKPAGTGR